MENNVYIVLDSWSKSGSSTIVGVYDIEADAKMALAEYVLSKKDGRFEYIEIVEATVGCQKWDIE